MLPHDIIRAFYSFTSKLVRPLVAIDPGPRKCGIATLTPSPLGGLYLEYSRQEPIRSLYDEKTCEKLNARKLTENCIAGIAGNFVNHILESARLATGDISVTGKVLMEIQPPAGVTGKSGQVTRTLACAIASAFTSNKWDVMLKTVKTYKERTFGLLVHPKDNWNNKVISKNFVKILAERYPIILSAEELKNEADISDALILLFSDLIELVATASECQELCKNMNTLQKLDLCLMFIQMAHQLRLDIPWEEKELQSRLQGIVDNEVYHKCYNQLIVAPVVKRESKSGRTKANQMLGTHGVPIVRGTLVNHLMVPLTQIP